MPPLPTDRLRGGTKPNVLAVVDGMIPSVELVLRQPFDFLQARGELTYSLHLISDPALPMSLAGFDALMLMRVYQPQALALAQAASLAGVSTIYVIDDDFSALDPGTPLGKHYRDAGAWPRILEICAITNVVWTFSQALVDKIKAVNPRVLKLPAIANMELVDRLRSEAPQPAQAGKVIGYAGSLTHAEDLASIARPLLAVLDARPDWSIEVVNVDAGRLARHSRVSQFPGLPSIEHYYRFVMGRNWSIGVAPLLQTAANDAKTDNKYREYAALGIAGVYSPALPYAASIAHDITGLFAETPDDWSRAILALVDDPSLRGGIVDVARQDVRARYSMSKVAYHYLDCLRAALGRPARVLVIAAAGIPSVEIDIARPLARLQSAGQVDWQLMEQEEVRDDDLADRDCVVVVRYTDPLTVDLLQRARDVHDVPTVYSWDDDFFAIPPGLGAITDYYRSVSTLDSLRQVLCSATLVKASTQRIAARSSEYAQHVALAPYGFDFDQISAPGYIGARRSEVVIGFFGSHSHGLNLALINPALSRIAAEYPNTRFELFGPNAAQFDRVPRVRCLPWCASSRESINQLRNRGWSIGLAPLQDNAFNRAKLPTKFRDYAACGIPGVYSKVDPYSDNVIDGESGLLAGEDTQSWYDAIRQLIENPELRRRIAARAYLHVRTELSVDGAVDAWRRIIVDLGAGPSVPEASTNEDADDRNDEATRERIALLEKRVRLLQMSSRLLLEQKQQIEGGKLGRLRKLVQKIRGANDMSRDRSPAFAHFQPQPGGANSAMMRLVLSANLQDLGCATYQIPDSALGCDAVEAAVSLPIPTLPGTLTVDVMTHAGETIHSQAIRIEDIDPFEPVRVPTADALSRVGAGGTLRFSARGSLAPIFVFQLEHAKTSQVVPFLAFTKSSSN